MANVQDIVVSAAINILTALAFLLAFALLRLQPVNDRVYFPKWYFKGIRQSPRRSGTHVRNVINLDCTSYAKFLSWMPAALHMPEHELIDHAGLDCVVYIRIYLLGLKILVPITLLSLAVLMPVNWTVGDTLKGIKGLTFSNIDRLSISNVPSGSKRFWVHLVMSYIFSCWTYYVLYQEYKTIASMRLQYLAYQNRHPDQFTVLVKNIPPDPDETVSEHVEHFFSVNHAHQYLLHQVVYNANKLVKLVEKKKSLRNWLVYYQNKHERNPNNKPTTKTGFLSLWGEKVDAIDYYTAEIAKLKQAENAEKERVLNDPKAIVPAAFVSFRTRWGAAVCAQTQQTSNPTIWLTEWAPQPRDLYWDNLAIPYVELAVRRLLIAIALFLLIFFFMIPIAFVQSLANIEGIEKALPFLKQLINKNLVKSVVQGFLPGIALKIFLALLPTILMTMSKVEGFTSFSCLEIKSAEKYYYFILVNVFLGSIVAGTAFQQLNKFIHESSTEYTKTISMSIPMKATFFITYTMVDGWAGIASEVLRLPLLIIFHLKNAFLVKTEQDRLQAMDPGGIKFSTLEPRTQLYLLLGLVYSPITPILLPFILIFFAFAYIVFRHQIINVYDQKYESAAAFWPHVHRRVIIGLIIAQLILMGLISTKEVEKSSFLLIAQPILTIWFHILCKGRFETVFTKFPLQDAMVRDTLERATDPTLNLREYLKDAYVHPVFKEDEERGDIFDEEEGSPLVHTKRTSYLESKRVSRASSKMCSHQIES